jgi:hypothetical protein
VTRRLATASSSNNVSAIFYERTLSSFIILWIASLYWDRSWLNCFLCCHLPVLSNLRVSPTLRILPAPNLNGLSPGSVSLKSFSGYRHLIITHTIGIGFSNRMFFALANNFDFGFQNFVV